MFAVALPGVVVSGQVHRSPGFITSNLIGKRSDGTMIKEFEASHGTVADLWHAHNEGKVRLVRALPPLSLEVFRPCLFTRIWCL
jgi:hypothetical protein